MRIMYHIGPWCEKQYKTIVEGIDENAETLQISGFRTKDNSNLTNRYYELLEQNKKKQFILNELDNDIIKRCRLLRSLKEEEALLHLNSMRQSIKEVFDSFNPDILVSETIDQYLMDLLFYECKNRKIPFIGLVVTFIDGYYRISAKGEYNYSRKSSEKEINKVINMLLKKDYKPTIISSLFNKSYKKCLKKYILNMLKIPYFFFRRLPAGEKYNYHYWASLKLSIGSFQLFPKFNIGEKEFIDKIDKIEKKKIFIPLQYYPEATIEYWCEELNVIEYEVKLLEYCKKLSKDFTLIVKEHPYVLGTRKSDFYKKLLAIDNLIFCPTFEDSNYLVELSDAVFVWTGSVGFESALRGKPVITVTKPYYMMGKQFKQITINTNNNEITNFIKEKTNIITRKEQEELVEYLLNGFFPGKYINNASWKTSNKQDVEDSLNIGKNIRNFICQAKKIK